jgi:hypothetical protein
LDSTATVTVPLLPVVPPPEAALLEPPPLEHAAAAVTSAVTHPATASLRLENLDELMYRTSTAVRTFWREAPPIPKIPICSFERRDAQMIFDNTVNLRLGNVKECCKYEMYALK